MSFLEDFGLKRLVIAGCLLVSTMVPSSAAVMADNITGAVVPFDNGTSIGNGTFSAADRAYNAFGLTTGSLANTFVSFETIFDNSTLLFNRTISGGIYSNLGGNPGSLLAAFNDVILPPQVFDVLLTTATAGPFSLGPNTSYWFVLTGPVSVGLLPNWQRDSANTAPVMNGATSLGYRFSSDNASTWSSSSTNNQLRITSTEDLNISNAPEPSAFVLSGGGLLVLAGAMRRRRSI